MKKILLIIVILLGLYGNYQNKMGGVQVVPPSQTTVAIETKTELINYKCDGRTHCSQMNSYEEAKFFVDNCPNTKMDGDHDGEPCESQF